MKNFFIQIIGLLVIIFVGMYLTINSSVINQYLGISETKLQTIKINDTEIIVELAISKNERAQGLGGRETLASNSGMLFIFEKPEKYTFWMKGMKIPIDIVWINNDQVVDITKNAQPPKSNQTSENLPTYQPSQPIDKVLEVNAGFSDIHTIKIGDKIELIKK